MAARFKAGAGEKATLAICTALMAILALSVSGVAIASKSLIAAALLAPSAAVLIGLCLLIASEASAAFRLGIEIDGDVLRLNLPPRRGHAPLPAVNRERPVSSVVAVETRSEVFRQLGVTALQQAYRLKFSDGSTVILGADRQMKQPLFGPAAELIAEHAQKPIADLGMVDGGAGFLAALGASVPDWSAPSLPADAIEKRRKAAARAFQIMTLTAALVTLARLIARR